jgi:hypothetical protein
MGGSRTNIPGRHLEGPCLSYRSNVSNRHATLVDDGYSAWLFLTNKSGSKVVADAFVYSRVEIPESLVKPFGENGPPLLVQQFATREALQKSVLPESLSIQFSQDGNSVAVFLRGSPWAFVIGDQERGYSKSISEAGPFGFPWDEQLYQQHFRGISSS